MSSRRKVPPGAKTIGDAVRALRKEQRMTLRSLAEKIGVSASFLSDLEHGRRQTNRYMELAAALNVRVEDLQALDGRVTMELKEWLTQNPQLVGLLEDIRHSGVPIPLTALRIAVRKSKN